MQIKRAFYTVNQLSEKWKMSTDDILHIGLTEQIEFTALVDEKYPNGYVQRGIEFPLSVEWLHNIIYGESGFEVVSTFKESSIEIPKEKLNERYPSTVTFYPGISRLVIEADEVERFENKLTDFSDSESKEIDQTQAIIQRTPVTRNTEKLEVIHAALDELERKNGKRPTGNETAGFMLSDEFQHSLVTSRTDRELRLFSGKTLDKENIKRIYHRTIYPPTAKSAIKSQ